MPKTPKDLPAAKLTMTSSRATICARHFASPITSSMPPRSTFSSAPTALLVRNSMQSSTTRIFSCCVVLNLLAGTQSGPSSRST
eukprot:8307109-Alexandrium_andersonii.AAC.1